MPITTPSAIQLNPNFPEFLDIKPLELPHHLQNLLEDTFGTCAQEEAIRRYGIAGRVWEAAYAMLRYVQPSSDLEFDSPFILPSDRHPLAMIELGSGSGLVAATISSLLLSEGDLFIATDLPEICPQLQGNLPCATLGPSLAVRALSWGNVQHASRISTEFFKGDRILTHIVCSDLVYFPDLLAPLLRSLIHLTSPPFATAGSYRPKIVISYKIRSLAKETPFWSAFGLWFEFYPLLARRASDKTDWERFGASSPEGTMFIFIAHRRQRSFQWQMPSDDPDLLSGVGAWGTASEKEDDTFESLLLMAMDNSDREAV